MILNIPPVFRKILFVVIFLCCLLPFVNSPVALVAGFFTTLLIGNPFQKYTDKSTGLALKTAIVGLGFSMNLQEAITVGSKGFVFTLGTITMVLLLAYFIGKLLKIDLKLSYLIGSGTAICGGSAIAAVGPVIKAGKDEMSVSLGIIFFLNAIALLLFPVLGHIFYLSQESFGLWSAVAIHDTSSVVGASSAYGEEALQIATTVKLARTLWIIPLTFISAIIFKGDSKKIKIPWFIGLFLLAIVANSYFPFISEINQTIVLVAKRIMILVLFLIGTSLSVEKIKTVGWKPLLLAVLLWIIISVVSLVVVM